MTYDILCLSHLDWDLAAQRPQHALRRFAQERRVFFVQKPRAQGDTVELEWSDSASGIVVVRPRLPGRLVLEHREALMRGLLAGLCVEQQLERYIVWYDTPMALAFTRQLTPLASIYDRTDDLPIYPETSPLLRERERQLLERADLVFVDRDSLDETWWKGHPNVYAFPSGTDTDASWDRTWREMRALIDTVVEIRARMVIPFPALWGAAGGARGSAPSRERGRLLTFPDGARQREPDGMAWSERE